MRRCLGSKTGTKSRKQIYNKAFFEKNIVKEGKIEDVEFTDLFYDLLEEGSDKRSLVGDGGLEPPTPCV